MLQNSPQKRPFVTTLYFHVLVGIVAGVLLGIVSPHAGGAMKPFADGFIKLIRMLIAPVIFSPSCWELQAPAICGGLGA